MGQYKSIIVKVGGKIPDLIVEAEPPALTAALNAGYEIKQVHQIATIPSSGQTGIVGVVILTYVLYKE